MNYFNIYLFYSYDAISFAAYCVVAVESAGRQLPIAFLERIKEEFTKKYAAGKGKTAKANGLKKEFGWVATTFTYSSSGFSTYVSFVILSTIKILAHAAFCSPKLKEQMKYCVEHPEEINKLAKVQAQVNEVKSVMMDNIEKVI